MMATMTDFLYESREFALDRASLLCLTPLQHASNSNSGRFEVFFFAHQSRGHREGEQRNTTSKRAFSAKFKHQQKISTTRLTT